MSKIIEAVRFAEKAHRGQTRKYNGRPYIEHPVRVMYKTVLHPDYTESMIIAAVLYDALYFELKNIIKHIRFKLRTTYE